MLQPRRSAVMRSPVPYKHKNIVKVLVIECLNLNRMDWRTLLNKFIRWFFENFLEWNFFLFFLRVWLGWNGFGLVTGELGPCSVWFWIRIVLVYADSVSVICVMIGVQIVWFVVTEYEFVVLNVFWIFVSVGFFFFLGVLYGFVKWW